LIRAKTTYSDLNDEVTLELSDLGLDGVNSLLEQLNSSVLIKGSNVHNVKRRSNELNLFMMNKKEVLPSQNQHYRTNNMKAACTNVDGEVLLAASLGGLQSGTNRVNT
jgi:hypothetical protein